jgi:hypothetical protein
MLLLTAANLHVFVLLSLLLRGHGWVFCFLPSLPADGKELSIKISSSDLSAQTIQAAYIELILKLSPEIARSKWSIGYISILQLSILLVHVNLWRSWAASTIYCFRHALQLDQCTLETDMNITENRLFIFIFLRGENRLFLCNHYKDGHSKSSFQLWRCSQL